MIGANLLGGSSYAIIQKELIVRIRRIRSLIIQLVFAAVVGSVMWIYSISELAGSRTSPEVHAVQLVGIYFIVQLCAICLVIPLLSAISITTELQAKTWDPLIGSGMRPGQIVRGKLYGILGILFYLLLLPAPLLSMTTLFGGVSVTSILFEYLIHFLAATLIASIGILSSASTRSTIRSILQVALLGVPLLLTAITFLSSEVYSEGILLLDYLEASPLGWQFWAWAIPGYIVGVVGSIMGATHFLSGVESARDVPIRILLLLCFIVTVGLIVITVGPDLQSGSRNSMSRDLGRVMTIFVGLSVLGLARIAGSEARVPLRIAQIRQRGHWTNWLGTLFFPGGIRNLVFATMLYMICFGAPLGCWILESSNAVTTGINFDQSGYSVAIYGFQLMLAIMCSWGVSVLSMAWFFGQCGFNGIISSVLANGVQVGLAMIVVTARELSLWSDKIEWLSPPMHLIYRDGIETAPEVVLVSIALTVLMIIGGVLIARGRGIPVWSIQRSGMDKLYLKIPEGN
ncbi:MAG: hypothetical protein VX949_05955 [Planctomycetota bacterium]|nr:hypothetical protein [Planctomycetota bacterium]